MRVKCDWCGKIFKRKPSAVKKSNYHFCSRKCNFEWMRGGKSAIARCDLCGKNFKKVPSRVTEHDFCSNKCYGLWISKNTRGENNSFYGKHHTRETLKRISESLPDYHKEKNPNWRGGKYKKCEMCGKNFWVKPSRMNTARFCSVKCKDEWIEKHEGTHFMQRYYVGELGHYVRSRWEEEVGLLLKANNITYGYESRTFKFNGTSYTPDFIAGNNVIEVKGPLPDSQRKKYREFNERYPELNFIMVGNGSDEICDIHIPWKERERLVGVLSG